MNAIKLARALRLAAEALEENLEEVAPTKTLLDEEEEAAAEELALELMKGKRT